MLTLAEGIGQTLLRGPMITRASRSRRSGMLGKPRTRVAVARWLIATLATVPPAATAQVHIVLNSCRSDEPNPIARFSIVSAPATAVPVCQMTVFPMSAECFPLQCITPDGWSCFPGDVTTFFHADAAPDDCVIPGATPG